MSSISDKSIQYRLNRAFSSAQEEKADSLAKLTTGEVFTPEDPRPADRYLAETMQFRVRSLASAKRGINDAVSMLQTAESSMAEINNMVSRMKELNLAAASTTVSDRERRFLFVEYEALHKELNRVALTTEFNGIPLLHGQSEKVPEEVIFRLDDPKESDGSTGVEGDINIIRFDGLKKVDVTTASLGLVSAEELLADSEEDGIALEDVEEMLLPEDEDEFTTVYDQAIARLSEHRASFGALQTRMEKAKDYIDVYQENIAAARSKIADIDYAQEVTRLVEAKINQNATTAMMAQLNQGSQLTTQLINHLF